MRIGMPAPDFSLTNYDGQIFTLSEELKQQPVILIFYPMDGSPNCDKLLCAINDDVDEFAANGYKIVGVNYAEPNAHGRYAKRKLLRLPLLSDAHYRVARIYDSLFSIGPIKVIRYSVVGISQDGIIKYYRRGRPSNQEIIANMKMVLQ